MRSQRGHNIRSPDLGDPFLGQLGVPLQGSSPVFTQVSALHSIATTNPQLAEKIRTEADYLDRMRNGCATQVSSPTLVCRLGVIEAGCNTVVGSRLNQSGMFWTIRGAIAVLALQCSHLNGRFEDYWARAFRRCTA